MDVMRDHQDPVAARDAGQRYESDQAGHREVFPRDQERGHAANEREGDVQHDLEDKGYGLDMCVE